MPDRSVVFRLWAPSATDVQLSGDWMGPSPPQPLTKDESGVWTVTSGPFEPNIYTYGYLVNGVRTSDPTCRCTLAWAGRLASSKFVIPASPPEAWEERRVPKGTLHSETYFSEQQNRARGFVVYTPPGYRDSASQRYPVLILLPGTPGDESDWTIGGGYADIVVDNLIAERRMKPIIIVMHSADVLPRNGSRADNLNEFEPLLVNELVPEIRKRYRVMAKPQSWAIAGLSLGGEVAMTVGLRHPELFRSIASISGSLVERDFEDRFGKSLARDDVSRKYNLIWIGCGSKDIFFGGAQAFAAKLKSAGVQHDFREFAGPHVMPVFRRELVELLPKLFR